MSTSTSVAHDRESAPEDQRIELLAKAGVAMLRYRLVFLLLLWGAFKFTAFEAEAIRPFVENSPYLGWLYGVFGVRGTADLVGGVEIAAALLIAARNGNR